MPTYTQIHKPVLLKEILAIFENQKISCFLDGTLGGGGHAEALLEAHPEIEKYIGLDKDPEALLLAKKRLERFGDRVEFHHCDFRHMRERLNLAFSGILLDIGFSSMQLEESQRGFSFMGEEPLDMRMDPTSDLDAFQLLHRLSERELIHLFETYGEERRAKKAVQAFCQVRRKREIKTTKEFASIILPHLSKKRGINPLTLVFQAIRIFVNDELKALEEGIEGGVELLCAQGKMAVISFHSLEDRIVKEKFRLFEKEERGVIVTKKPLSATREEVKKNARSRSAKLRAFEKR